MKVFLRKTLVLTAVVSLFSVVASAQCTIDPSLTYQDNWGFIPDTATNFKKAQLNQAYNQLINFRAPANAKQVDPSQLAIPIQWARLDSASNIPPGLRISCNPSNCQVDGGKDGCGIITGVPTQAGVYNLVLHLTGNAGSIIGDQSFDIVNYRIIVEPSSDLTELNKFGFSLGQNIPNPFNNMTRINFDANRSMNVAFEVMNIMGQTVFQNNISAHNGQNTIDFDASELPSGIYMYSIGNGANKLTKKMIVQ